MASEPTSTAVHYGKLSDAAADMDDFRCSIEGGDETHGGKQFRVPPGGEDGVQEVKLSVPHDGVRALSASQLSVSRSPPLRHNVEHLKRTRLLEKDGRWNIRYIHSRRRRQIVQDLFTSLVEAQWRYTLLMFGLAFIVSWLVFSVVWYVIAVAHHDLDHVGEEDWRPCVNALNDFTSAFLFSLETQHTIGYGSRHINEECPEAVILLILQSVGGVLIQCIVAGLVFSKFARSKKRAETLKFSQNAVVGLRDDKLCLMYRMGDSRKTHLLNAQVRAQLVTKRVTKEGEVAPLHQQDLQVGLHTGEESIFMIWPVVVVHWITASSPLYTMDSDTLSSSHFELIVTVDGAVQSNGMSIQARSSYLPNEILWGHRFKRMVSWSQHQETYVIDHDKFHSTVGVPCPKMSARDIELAGGISALPDTALSKPGHFQMLSNIMSDLGTPASSPTTKRKSKRSGFSLFT